MTGNTTPTRGFTLIETLIAVLVLAMAITGPVVVAARGLSAALTAKQQTTALFLAQDAMEYVYFLRNTNVLSGNDWFTNLGSCTSADGSASCYMDSLAQNPTTPQSCSGNCSNFPIYYDSNNNIYTYTSTGTRTIFTRSVSIKKPIGSNTSEAAVTVTVSWRDRGAITRSVSITENLFNWQ